MPISLLLFVVVIKFPATFFLFSIIFFFSRAIMDKIYLYWNKQRNRHTYTPLDTANTSMMQFHFKYL